MNILILTTRLSGGGAERVAAGLSHGLARDHTVSLCVFGRGSGTGYAYSGTLFDLGIDLSASSPRKYLSLMSRLPELHRIKRESNIDLTISHLSAANFANLMTPAGDRQVISLHNCVSRRLAGYSGLHQRALIRLLYPRADRTVCVSEGVKVDAIDHGFISENRASTIKNPIDLDQVRHQADQPLPPELQTVFERPTLINAGRFSEEKGQRHLIRVFAEVHRRRSDVNLLLLGTGERYSDLLREAHKYGLTTAEINETPSVEDDVIFAGHRENPFMFYRAADVFVLPSHWEGLPNVIIEAMACGTPVISTDCRYGPRELLAPSTDVRTCTAKPEEAKYGILMPEFHPSSPDEIGSQPDDVWGETLTRLLSDGELRSKFAQRGRERAQDFAQERIFDQWRELLAKMK